MQNYNFFFKEEQIVLLFLKIMRINGFF